MGGTLSKQEELFVLHQWHELLESAMGADTREADISGNGSAERNKRTSAAFRMSFQEWQALITLLESSEPSEAPSRLCASLGGAQLVNPIVAVMVHSCCWCEGSIKGDVFLDRLARLQEEVQLRQETQVRQTKEMEMEKEAVNTALLLLKDMVQPMTSSPLRASRNASSLVQSFISWDGCNRPVIMLAHVFIVGVLACVHLEPHYAEAAIHSLRGLQEAISMAAASVSNAERGEASAAVCNIIEWRVVKYLEGVLARRQQEQDVADLIATTDRWWLPSQSAADDGASMTSEERWAEVSSQYIGQKHIWTTLRTHFLCSDVFNAEKPTVIVLFGPSGFGKSEMARRIACTIYGMEARDLEASGKLVYIHLPSFCTRDSIYSLVDPPAAHVGEGVLLSALRRNEDAVVVLDEFEKGTAEAIQNLWLSAFQKKGTLRSLKDASRSVSTEKVTFVLTCNIAADTILRNEGRYLQATPAEQVTMRDEWTNLCKESCRRSMHDPFVNRVDYFFPFVPYTEEEKRCFIQMQLRRIVQDQRAKGRRIYITSRFVSAIAKKLQTFHASTIEGVVRPLLVEMMQSKWDDAVLTVKECVAGTNFVVIPTRGNVEGATSWFALTGGEQSLSVWDDPEDNVKPLSRTKLAATSAVMSSERKAPRGGCGTRHTDPEAPDIIPAAAAGAVVVATEEKERLLQMETSVEKELQVELEKMKELLVLKDKEIAYLKKKVLRLEKALALLLVTMLMCMLLLSLLVGTKLVLTMGFMLFVALQLLVGMPLDLLLGAIHVLYRVLGPIGSAIAAIVVSMWMSQSIRSATFC